MKLDKNFVFIIGCPRSGTTYLLKTLAANRNFAWVSSQMDKSPDKIDLIKNQNIFDKFYSGKRNYRKQEYSYVKPVEPWGFWNYHFEYFQWNKKFSNTPINALPEHNSDRSIKKVRNAVDIIFKETGKNVFLSKYTDFPRVQLIKKAFPNAKIIHLVRDGRAVANSYNQKIKSGDFNTSKEEENWVSAWPKEWQKEFSDLNKNPLSFTLYQWLFFVTQINNELKSIPSENYIELNYSDLVTNTSGTIQKILDFVDVKMDRNLKFFLNHHPGDNKNNKWQNNLSEDEQKIFKKVLEGKGLEKYLDK